MARNAFHASGEYMDKENKINLCSIELTAKQVASLKQTLSQEEPSLLNRIGNKVADQAEGIVAGAIVSGIVALTIRAYENSQESEDD